MDYVQTLSKIYSDNNEPFEWVTPTNLLVRQLYPNTKKFRIETRINGSILKLNFRRQIENTVNKRKSSQGSSPNYIHSLDASALTFCVNRCLDEGIKSFAMVHDSYATHSPNMGKLNHILREEYVKMYSNNDVLEQLYERAVVKFPHIEIPVPPAKGSFNINEILDSDYFFA
jgi:DNA-directed RNA polymerase